MFCALLSPFTLFVPLNIWLGILNGMSLEGWWKIFIPSIYSWFVGIKGEKDWPLY